MDKNCNNYGSSWCADFECGECPVRDLKDSRTMITGLDDKPTPKSEDGGLVDSNISLFQLNKYANSGWSAMRWAKALTEEQQTWVKILLRGQAKAQRDLTRAECQARVERVVKWLDDNNDLKWRSLKNSPDHCGLGIPMEKWQEFRQDLKKQEGIE